MAIENTDERNLAGTPGGPQFHEDLMDKINDISPEDLPFTDMISSGTSKAHFKEFVEEQLEDADQDNMVVDGNDITRDDSVLGQRKGAYHQTSVKAVRVSDRTRNINAVGTSDELVKQVAKRNRALRRDVEARMTSIRPTLAGNGEDTPSQAPGIGAWIGTSGAGNSFRGAGGVDPVLNDTPGGAPTVAPVVGTARPMTEALLKSALRAAYKEGGNLKYAMSVPEVIENMSDYMYTSSARIAAMQTNVSQGNRQGVDGGNGSAGGGIVAQGSVNIYVSNFGSVIFTPNRFQPLTGTDIANLYLIDPDLWEQSFLQGYRMKNLAVVGLSTNRMISVDYTLCALAERGNAVVADIDITAPMVAA